MAIVVEDGTGVDGANSYASVADADAYFAERGISTWTGSDSVKEQALIRATDYIDVRFALRFLGQKVASDQALSWPRNYAYDQDGNLLEGVPVKLKRACYEYAVRALAGVLQPDPVLDSSGRIISSKSSSVGPVSSSVTYESGNLLSYRPYPAADALLAGLISPGGRTYR